MSSEGSAPAPSSIRFGEIVFAEVLDPNGRNPKIRCVVVLTPDDALAEAARSSSRE